MLTKASDNIIQMIPTLASCSFDEIVAAAAKDQVQWMQLYVNKDREITKKIVQYVHFSLVGCTLTHAGPEKPSKWVSKVFSLRSMRPS